MFIISGIYYVNLVGSWYLNDWQYLTRSNIDFWVINLLHIVAVFFAGDFLSRKLLRPVHNTILYGTRFISCKQANDDNRKINKALKLQHPLTIGAVEIAHAVESQHFMICGTTGSGKTQAITHFLATIGKRNKKAIIVDAGGGFIRHFYTTGDKILNPFDQRSVGWSPFAEIRQEYDCQMMAKLTIPDASGSSKEWNFYAQTLLAECLLALYKQKDYSVSKLLYYISASSQQELASLLATTPAAILTQDSNDKMLNNTRAVIANYINAWRYLPDTYNFSIRNWLQDEEDTSWLFISYRDDQIQLLRHFVAMCLGISITENLCLPEDSKREIWHIYDEVDTLGKVEALRAGLTKLRKYGGRMVLGLQTISQLQEIYGKFDAQTLLANISTKLILRAGDHETASYFSQEIGEQGIIKESQSYTASSGQYRSDSTGESYSQTRQLAIMPSQIMQLPELTGILKTPTSQPSIVIIPYLRFNQVASNFENQS